MTEEELEEIEKRANAATEGPWEVVPDPDKPYLDKVVRHYGHLTDLLAQCFHTNGNATFIAHAREDVPALIAEVRRLRAENQELSRVYSTVEKILTEMGK